MTVSTIVFNLDVKHIIATDRDPLPGISTSLKPSLTMDHKYANIILISEIIDFIPEFCHLLISC